MLQPPQSHKECPRCGYSRAILILDFEGLFPQLDSLGNPQYHCPNCADVFTGAESQQDEQSKEGDVGKHDAQDI